MLNDKPIGSGWLRQDGRKGIRNKVLVIFTVDCSYYVCQQIAAHFKALGADVDFIGNRACIDNQVNIRRLLAFSTHPNVGAVLVIGLGCEYVRPDRICDFAARQGRIADWFNIQDQGGTARSIARGKAIVEDMLEQLGKQPKVPLYWRDLCVGSKCGGSDFASGLAANPLVGSFFDRQVDRGGTCFFEELTEAIGLRDYLCGRAATEQAREQIGKAYDKNEAMCMEIGQFAITPGNFDGGLTTIEEKSMGATIKSGTRPIQGVLKVAQQPDRTGLWLVDTMRDMYYAAREFTSGGDAYTILDMVACGAQLNLLTTGRGHCINTPVAPTVKITGNSRTFQKMNDDIDLDAGQLLVGTKTMDQLTDDLEQLIIDICAGKKSKGEALGHQESELSSNYQHPYRIQGPLCRR